MLSKIHLDWDFGIFLKADYSNTMSSCIQHQVYELTDIHEAYGGFPKSYCFENTKIHQLWWDNTQIDFVNLGKQLGIEVVTVSSICQPPGCVVPLHRDTFYQINNRYPDCKELKVRANIYLEDCKLGHMIQYQTPNGFETSINWQAGDGFMWDTEILHLSGNAGMKDKYTLQVSGFLKKS
jgi:hypothetical protein